MHELRRSERLLVSRFKNQPDKNGPAELSARFYFCPKSALVELTSYQSECAAFCVSISCENESGR
jgi:hypothetical protein